MPREPRLKRDDPPGRRSDASSLLGGYSNRGCPRPAAGRGLRSAIVGGQAEWLPLDTANAAAGGVERLDLGSTSCSLEGERGRRIVPYLCLAVSIADEEGWMTRMEERGTEMRAVNLREGTGLAIVARDRAVARLDLPAHDLTIVIHLSIETLFELHDDSSSGAN